MSALSHSRRARKVTLKRKKNKALSLDSVTKIHVGNRIFAVEEVEDGSVVDALGEVFFALGKVNLAPHQTPDCLADTLLHEVIHIIDYIFGSTGTYLTEEQVVKITGGLLTVLHDPRNRSLVSFLTTAQQDD